MQHFCSHLRTKEMLDDVDHATSCNMVAKRVQHVGFNNVGWCCINMLDPFGRALSNVLSTPKRRL